MTLPAYPCLRAPIDGHCPETPTYMARECTSGASWWGSRITGKPWPTGWGDADNWPAAARKAGMDVDSNCTPNSIMCIPPNTNDAGKKGHVAVVVARPIGGKVTVWEMNFLIEHGFDFRQARIDGCEYIHLVPVPQPPVGDDDLTPQQAQMLQDIHDAMFKPVATAGGEGYPSYAPGNNLDIVRRVISPYNKGYPNAQNPPKP